MGENKLPERDYYNSNKFKSDDKFQSQIDLQQKRDLKKLIDSTFNISVEARSLADNLTWVNCMSDAGIFRVVLVVKEHEFEGNWEVQLGKSGIISCSCGAVDELSLDICGHILCGLRIAGRKWCGTVETIENYVKNVMLGDVKK
jgi:hypothetical protein